MEYWAPLFRHQRLQQIAHDCDVVGPCITHIDTLKSYMWLQEKKPDSHA
jgi:hypothetical protein